MSEARMSTEAWAFIAHKDGYWAGVASASLSKKSLRQFLGDFAAEGFTITTVHDREEYNAVIGKLKQWHLRDMRTARESDQLALAI